MKENIEEDIKVAKKLIKTMEQDRITFKDEQAKEIYAYFITALENILSDYKRVLKENEELKQSLIINKKLYEELCNKNNELKRDNELARQALKKQCDIADERNQLLKENAFLKGRTDALIRIKKDLETQRDYYKARYLEFNNAFIKKEDKQ